MTNSVKNMTLSELFTAADKIGNKYQTQEEIDAHKAEMQAVKTNLSCLTCAWYSSVIDALDDVYFACGDEDGHRHWAEHNEDVRCADTCNSYKSKWKY